MNTSTCTTHNGTYACMRPAGHAGLHMNTRLEWDGQARRHFRTVRRFADGYSAVLRSSLGR